MCIFVLLFFFFSSSTHYIRYFVCFLIFIFGSGLVRLCGFSLLFIIIIVFINTLYVRNFVCFDICFSMFSSLPVVVFLLFVANSFIRWGFQALVINEFSGLKVLSVNTTDALVYTHSLFLIFCATLRGLFIL